jgi:serine/threonine-protein kinase
MTSSTRTASGKRPPFGLTPVQSLAVAIADGSLINWDRVQRGASKSAQQSLVRQLRAIATVAGTYRRRFSRDSVVAQPETQSAAIPQTDQPSHTTWGDLTLIEEIGRGAFGTVFRAHDRQLDRPVALKLLRAESSKKGSVALQLLREGRVLAQVRHPNVVTVYKAEKHGGRIGLLMEFIHGLTLEQMLTAHGPFSAGEAVLIGRDVCNALAAVHFAGLVHRDVKAQNIMREQGGRLVLMDFGAGGQLNAGNKRRLRGTPLYIAPEVLKGGESTVRSDIFAVGVLLYHLVTGEFPVKGGSLDTLRRAYTDRRVAQLKEVRPDLPAAFVRVVEKAIRLNPAQRFASANQMESALARVLGLTVRGLALARLRPARRAVERIRAASSASAGSLPSIAVLPFTDMSPAKDQESFCDGMTEELINAFTQVPGLRVAARTSAFQFKGHASDVRNIGDALNVAAVLDGSVRTYGDRLRVTVDLIGTADGFQLWSHHFDCRLPDVFALQDEIAGSVVTTLKGKLTETAGGKAAMSRSRDLRAYRCYLEGRYYWNKRTEVDLERSVGFFQQAIDRDPGYAKAHAALADAYVTLATYGAITATDVMPRAKSAVERALAIDPSLAEAFACRGCVRSVYEWQWKDAERDFAKAIELRPSYATAHHLYAMNLLVPLGRPIEATEELHHALDLDPLALVIRMSLGMNAYFAGGYDEAVRELSKTIELDDRFGMAHLFLAAAFTELGRYPAARGELDTAMRLSGRTPEALGALGYLHGVSGDVEAARAVQSELLRMGRERYVSPARLAQVHTGLDQRDEALAELERACAERAADIAWVAVRPVFARLRTEPRFEAILDRLNF